MNKNTVIIGIVAIVLALGAWYYFGRVPAPVPQDNSSVSSGMQNTSDNAPAGGMETGELPAGTPVNAGVGANAGVTAGSVKSFTVTGSNYSFSPNSISVKRGDHVKITFQNANGSHDLKIDGFNVGTPIIGSGQSASVEFIADKTGSFQYYCAVGNHRAMGMWGTLVVSE
jgi:plastocyanin